MVKIAIIALLSQALVFAAARKSYDGYKLLRTSPLLQQEAEVLNNIQSKLHQLDFWKDPVEGFSSEILVAPKDLKDLEELLLSKKIEFTTKVENIQSLINLTEVQTALAERKKNLNPDSRYSLTWDRYYDFDVFNEFLEELAEKYDFVETVSMGSSYEGRDMKVLQIKKAGPSAPNIWIEGGIHAREWISPAVVTYLIRELLENNDAHPHYLDTFNFHINPSVNPDGYQYSRTEDRYWRKTRSGSGRCVGVDGNRNFDYHFGESGVSSFNCADNYPGEEAFSEIETRNIRDYLLALEPTPIVATAFHSAAELWLYPYGYKRRTYPENVDEMREACEEATASLNSVHGMTFQCIHSANLYPAAGDSNDWYTGVLGARFAYTLELRDQGYGFELPPRQIIPSGEEMWQGYKVILDRAMATLEE